jgi:hypothetical protein
MRSIIGGGMIWIVMNATSIVTIERRGKVRGGRGVIGEKRGTMDAWGCRESRDLRV